MELDPIIPKSVDLANAKDLPDGKYYIFQSLKEAQERCPDATEIFVMHRKYPRNYIEFYVAVSDEKSAH
jgi:hypothetical protein